LRLSGYNLLTGYPNGVKLWTYLVWLEYYRGMTIRAKELLLHKVVATSAFVFALCILPVAQYLLIGHGAASQRGEQGTVAGVSTDSSITEASVPTPTPATTTVQTCEVLQQQKLESLQAQLTNWIASEKQLEVKYPQDYSSYESAITQETAIVSSQKVEDTSASCLAE